MNPNNLKADQKSPVLQEATGLFSLFGVRLNPVMP